jgi:hypothetical protein
MTNLGRRSEEWTMLDEMWRAAAWPLRSLGLDPGRALANAQPTPDVRQAQRLEQWVYVRAGFDATSAHLAADECV